MLSSHPKVTPKSAGKTAIVVGRHHTMISNLSQKSFQLVGKQILLPEGLHCPSSLGAKVVHDIRAIVPNGFRCIRKEVQVLIMRQLFVEKEQLVVRYIIWRTSGLPGQYPISRDT